MLCSPVDNNARGSCRDKRNINKQCSPHQESECSVRNVREPIQANSFVEGPEEDFFKNDTFTGSKAGDREDTGCSRITSNGVCEGRMCEESRPSEDTTLDDVDSANDLNNSRCHRSGFVDEQQCGAKSSRWNSESWTGRESSQVPTSTFRLTKDPATNQRSALPLQTLNNRSLTNRIVKNRSNLTPGFEKELYRVEQRRAKLMRRIERKQRELVIENRKVRTSLQNDCEQQSSGCEKQSLHVPRERRPSQRDTRECRPSLHDIRERQQSQDGTSERRLSHHDTSKRRQLQHDTSERRTSQYDTRRRRTSQHDTSKRQQSHHDTSKRRQLQHDTSERRTSQYDTSRRQKSHHDTSKRRQLQHDTSERRTSQYDTRRRRTSQHDTTERQQSHHDTSKRGQPQHDSRERRPSQGNIRERLPSQHDTREHRISQYDLRERQPSMLHTRGSPSLKGESKNREQPLAYVVECFCNFSAIDNGCNNEPVTKQVQLDETYQPPGRGVSDRNSCCPIRVSSRHNNTNADKKTEVQKAETARKDAASTGRHSRSRRHSRSIRHSRSSRSSTPRNNASVTSPDSAEQHLSNQDTLRPRGCPCPRVVDLMSSTNDNSATAVGGNQNHNNRGFDETQ